jgi:hypothetical protein
VGVLSVVVLGVCCEGFCVRVWMWVCACMCAWSASGSTRKVGSVVCGCAGGVFGGGGWVAEALVCTSNVGVHLHAC